MYYAGMTIPEGEGAAAGGGEHVPEKPITPMNCKLDLSMQRRSQGQTLDCKRWMSLLSAAKGLRLHTAGEV